MFAELDTGTSTGSEGRISGPPVGERPTRLLKAARPQGRKAARPQGRKAASKGSVALRLLVKRGAAVWLARPDLTRVKSSKLQQKRKHVAGDCDKI